MYMAQGDLYNLEPPVKKIIQDFNGILEWQKDNWIKSSLAEFLAKDKDKVQQILNKHLPYKWNQATLSDSPKKIQTIAGNIGGVKDNQWLMASEPEKENFIFGAWWPWSGGEKISIRLAPFSENFSTKEMEEFIKVFQSWFE